MTRNPAGQNLTSRRWLRIALLGLALHGLLAAGDIKLSRLMQKKRHHEIIRILQPKVDGKEILSSFNRLFLASSYFEIRDYAKLARAIEQLEQNIAQGDRSYVGGSLEIYPALLRGEAALDLGDPGTAAREAAEALRLLNQIGPSANAFYDSQLIAISGLQGIAYAQLRRPEEADRSLKVLRGIDPQRTANAPDRLNAMARIHLAKREFSQALAALQDPSGKVSWFISLLTNETYQDLPKHFIVAKCQFETGQLEEARKGYDQLLKHPQLREIGGLHWLILLDRARIARREGQAGQAETLLKQAVEVIEGQRASIQTESGRIGYVGDKQEVYQELISLLAGADRSAEALEFVERAKGRALVDLLASQKNLQARSLAGDKALATLRQLSQAEQEAGIVSDPEQKASTTRGVVLTLRQEIAAAAPELTSLVMVTRTPIDALQQRLAADETLLEFFSSGKQWYAFTATRAKVQVKILELPDLKARVEAARSAFLNPASDTAQQEAEAMYDLLVKPVADRLAPGRLTIVPHGVLHYLPFGALGAGGSTLLDRFSLRVLPSASVLQFLKAKKPVKQALVMGNPDLGDPRLDLAFAQEEAMAIAKIVPEPTVLMRGAATASTLKQSGGQFDLLHFAAHGSFDPERPLNSALYLAKDAGSDGVIRVADLYAMNLNADLATLSACETGLAKVSSGDDVVGFTRGLLYAGARSIVSSLWKVDDQATRDLMVAFYQGLTDKPKAEALRQAQLVVRSQRPHPFYWAGFVLTGNGE